uniref:Uncharacterized protein n=1 Tax=Arundo donax TaxID=35708 RepID=A0A0A8XT07_ARUDO
MTSSRRVFALMYIVLRLLRAYIPSNSILVFMM